MCYRCIICHDVKEVCRQFPDHQSEAKLLQDGILPANLFNRICEHRGKDEKLIKNYLLKFSLAVELDDAQLFIPSLVSTRTKV